jgi:RecA-family ATPase
MQSEIQKPSHIKPQPLLPKLESVPAELKQVKNWLMWRYLPPRRDDGKWRKVPFQPNGQPASTVSPSTWNTFDDCRSAYERGGFSGIGFVFDGKPDENGLVYAGVDFDSEACTGEIAIETAEWVDRFGSYVENSVSGTGAHVIVKAKPLASGIAHDGVELYTSGRFFTMTGHTPGNPSPIVAVPAEFAALANEVQAKVANSGDRDTQRPSVTKNNLAGFELPDWALTGGPAKAFEHLAIEPLSGQRESSVEEINSAVSAIPPAVIGSEPDWMRFARALAHQAAMHPDQAEQLWEILDAASRVAPHYDRDDNHDRFERYIKEALDRESPITVATIFHMAIEHGWQGWSPPLAPSTSAPLWSAADLAVSFVNIPHRRWLYGTYLIRGEVTVLAAPGGAGKTALATGIAVEIATGIDLLGEKIYQARDLSVLFINGEDASTEIRRRLWAVCLAYANKLAGKNLDRLYVAGANDPQVQCLSFLRTTDRSFSVLDQSGFQILESGMSTLRPDLVVLDPLVAFCGGGNMNDNAVMAQVVRELKHLATKHDCAVLVVHHTRKGIDDGNADAISGASAIVNLARKALMPVPMTKEEAEQFRVLPSERSRYFKLVDAKSNLAPRAAETPWYYLHSVSLPNAEPPVYLFGDNVQAIQRLNLTVLQAAPPTTDEQKIRDSILDLVRRGKTIHGRSYPYSPSAAGANKERGLLNDAMAAVEAVTAPRAWTREDLSAATKRAVKEMKDEGVLVEKNMKELISDPGRFRKGRGLTINEAPQPGLQGKPSQDAETDATLGDIQRNQ